MVSHGRHERIYRSCPLDANEKSGRLKAGVSAEALMKLNSHKKALLRRLRSGATIYRDASGKLRMSDNQQEVRVITFHDLVKKGLIEPMQWKPIAWVSVSGQ
jgi:hypothetical protein